MNTGFHARDGWYFERDVDGSVTIQRRLSLPNGAKWPVEHVRLDAATWASVVASVSHRGETSDTFREAEQLHSRGPDQVQSHE